MKKITILLSIFIISCQTYRTIIPTINGSVKQDIKLKKPIIIAFKDSRLKNQDSEELILSLKQGLKTIYGDNLIFKSFFDKTDDNNVALKINIKEIGSNFGIRTIQYQTYRNQITAVSSSVSTYWGSAVSTAIISQPIIQSQFSAQGYWVGTSYLEITLVDNLHKDKQIYNFPFVGEDKQNNTWGYKSATIASENSWNKVSSHLIDLIDSIAINIIENE